MPKFMTIKPGEKVQIRLLRNEIEGVEPWGIHYFKPLREKEIPCPYCEDDRIKSRFEILDL